MTDVTCIPCLDRLPSCKGLPDGDNAVPGKYWAENYLHCYMNRTLGVQKCDFGFYFHPYKKRCLEVLEKGKVFVVSVLHNVIKYHNLFYKVCTTVCFYMHHVSGTSDNQSNIGIQISIVSNIGYYSPLQNQNSLVMFTTMTFTVFYC